MVKTKVGGKTDIEAKMFGFGLITLRLISISHSHLDDVQTGKCIYN